jgi:hypothetical protein
MAVSRVSHLLAGDSWLPVPGGVKHVSQLQRGGQALLVKPDGTIGLSSVCSVDRLPAPAPCASLVTRVGELLVPDGTRIVTRRGVESVEDLVVASRTGQQPRVEIVQPADVFARIRATGSKKDAYRAALAALPRKRIVIPGWLERDSDTCDQIEDVLVAATTTFKRHSLENWCVFDFDRPDPSQRESMPWTRTDAQQHAMMLLTAWSLEEDKIVSRILDGEVSYLQRLSGCLAASGGPYEVKWLPGYRPVEARVSRGTSTPGSHAPVLRMVRRVQDVYRVSVSDAGAMIVGLALVS